MKNIFNLKTVEGRKIEMGMEYLKGIKEYLDNRAGMIEYSVILASGMIKLEGTSWINGEETKEVLSLLMEKNGKIINIEVPIGASIEEIEEEIKFSMLYRESELVSGSYLRIEKREFYSTIYIQRRRGELVCGHVLTEPRNIKFINKLRKFVNKNKIEIPNYVNKFYIDERNGEDCIVFDCRSECDFYSQISKVINVCLY